MSRKKNITLFFENFTHEHLGKDPFFVPYIIGKKLGYNVNIVYPLTDDNLDLPNSIRGVKLIPLEVNSIDPRNDKIFSRVMYRYIWNHAKEIDIMIRFFDYDISRIAALIYKLRNPRGIFYIKMDIDPYAIPNENTGSCIRKMLRFIKNNFLKHFVDILSCETSFAFESLNNTPNSYYQWDDKLIYIPNGFEEESLMSYNITEVDFSHKENVMLTVARLGTYQKNTSMILKALQIIDLKNWKFYLIGPIEEEFKQEVEKFYSENPDKIGKVIFTGPIYDKKELWEFYNRSKVFVLTSKFESFGLVYTEAQRFKNYIVSTLVGAAKDVIEDSKYGEYIKQDDHIELAHKLSSIINNVTDIDVYSKFQTKSLSWESRLDVLVERIKFIQMRKSQ